MVFRMEESNNFTKDNLELIENDTLIEDDSNDYEWLFYTIDCRMLPTVTIVGLLLQSLNVAVLLSKHLRNNAIRFLAAMSVMDVLFLFIHLPFLPIPFILQEWPNASPTAVSYYKFEARYYERFVLYPMSRVLLATNTWLAVLVSVERYLALMPSSSSCVCVSRYGVLRRKLSLPAIITAVIIAALLNMNCFFEFTKSANANANSSNNATEPIQNEPAAPEEGFDGPDSAARFVLTYLLPFFLQLAFNSALVYLLLQYRNRQLRLQTAAVPRQTHSCCGGFFGLIVDICWQGLLGQTRMRRRFEFANQTIHSRRRRSRSTLSTALMVIVAMLVHLALATPATTVNVLVFLEGQTMLSTNHWFVLASHASNVLIIVHCSIDWCVGCHWR